MKKSNPKNLFLAFFLFALGLSGHTQVIPYDSTLTKILQTDILLPLLVDSAVKNSPDIKRTEKNIGVFEESLSATRKSLLNSVILGSSYGYGTTGDIALGKDLSGLSQYTNFRSTKTSRYNLGVSIQLPLGNLLSHKNFTHSSQLQIEMAEDEKENTVLFVKQQVIKLYQEFKLAHTLLMTSGKIKQTSHVSISIAQKDFVGGQVSVDQFSKLQNDYNQTIMDYDTQMNKFQTSFLMLEAYTGVQLAKLINHFK